MQNVTEVVALNPQMLTCIKIIKYMFCFRNTKLNIDANILIIPPQKRLCNRLLLITLTSYSGIMIQHQVYNKSSATRLRKPTRAIEVTSPCDITESVLCMFGSVSVTSSAAV